MVTERVKMNQMRYGFTTGSCAAAAAKAAAYMLLSGRLRQTISIQTPKGIWFDAQIGQIMRTETCVSCAVKKDGGDDPDVTSGAWIVAKAAFLNEVRHPEADQQEQIIIDGGSGVGRVTKPGLDQPVGSAAINHVPRQMIKKEVESVCRLFDYNGRLSILIEVPGGEAIAEQTFNPRLGITGGISILGTSGIVEPMSRQALLDTIRVELQQKKALGFDPVAVSPGNYGLDFMRETYGYDLDGSVKCSNFIGETMDMAIETGFHSLLLTGHIGKLVKVSGGIMNTHSREADCRMELLAAAGLFTGTDRETLQQILSCVTTEEALALFSDTQRQAVMERVLSQILFYLDKRCKGRLQIECILYSNDYGELAKSPGAMQYLEYLKGES